MTNPHIILLTFYSGKLWHSDKPFPVKPVYSVIFRSKCPRSYADTLSGYKRAVQTWLSTAYEVQNPEVIPKIVRGGVNMILLGWDTGNETLNEFSDGDQITLPDGYGIEKHYQPDSGPLVRRVSIILPEKPDNSSHGYTELLSKEQFNSPANQNRDNAIVGFIKTGLDKIDESGLQLTNQDKAQLLNKRIENLSRVEPSESQEETYNCADCNAPLIKKKNATVLDPPTLLCHSCWTETWAILFQMIREGKYDQCKEKFILTRRK